MRAVFAGQLVRRASEVAERRLGADGLPAFGQVCAAYGGIFIALAQAWGIIVDGFRPDRWDILGAAICASSSWW